MGYPFRERRRLTFAHAGLFSCNLTPDQFKADMVSLMGEENVEATLVFNADLSRHRDLTDDHPSPSKKMKGRKPPGTGSPGVVAPLLLTPTTGAYTAHSTIVPLGNGRPGVEIADIRSLRNHRFFFVPRTLDRESLPEVDIALGELGKVQEMLTKRRGERLAYFKNQEAGFDCLTENHRQRLSIDWQIYLIYTSTRRQNLSIYTDIHRRAAVRLRYHTIAYTWVAFLFYFKVVPSSAQVVLIAPDKVRVYNPQEVKNKPELVPMTKTTSMERVLFGRVIVIFL